MSTVGRHIKFCRFFILSIALLCAAIPAGSRERTKETELSARYGRLSLARGDDGADEIRLDSKRVYVPQGIKLHLVRKFTLDDREVLLVGDAPVDKGCNLLYFFVAVKPGGKIAVSPEFGTCGGVRGVGLDGDKVLVRTTALNEHGNPDHETSREYAYYVAGSSAGLLTEDGHVITETRATPKVSKIAPFDIAFRLPPGYKHTLQWIVDGEDGLCGNTQLSELSGYLWKPGGLVITYRVRPGDPPDRAKVEKLRNRIAEFREETRGGRLVQWLRLKTGETGVYLENNPAATFSAHTHSQAERNEMRAIVLSYAPCPGVKGICPPLNLFEPPWPVSLAPKK